MRTLFDKIFIVIGSIIVFTMGGNNPANAYDLIFNVPALAAAKQAALAKLADPIGENCKSTEWTTMACKTGTTNYFAVFIDQNETYSDFRIYDNTDDYNVELPLSRYSCGAGGGIPRQRKITFEELPADLQTTFKAPPGKKGIYVSLELPGIGNFVSLKMKVWCR